MAIITKTSNYRVIVTPHISNITRSLFGTQEALQKEMKDKANEILQSIKRHVDNIDSITMECDNIEVCSYCGIEYGGGEPNCCNEAVNEWNAKTDLA